MKNLLLFIDLETGGLTPQHSPLEFGALACLDVPGYPVIAEYRALVQLDAYTVTAAALGVNGLSIEQCAADGLPPDAISAEVLALLDGAGIVAPAGWNVGFDLLFVRTYFPALSARLHFRALDVQSVSRFLLRGAGSLGAVCRRLGVVEERAAHTALGDCWRTLQVARRLQQAAAEVQL